MTPGTKEDDRAPGHQELSMTFPELDKSQHHKLTICLSFGESDNQSVKSRHTAQL